MKKALSLALLDILTREPLYLRSISIVNCFLSIGVDLGGCFGSIDKSKKVSKLSHGCDDEEGWVWCGGKGAEEKDRKGQHGETPPRLYDP